MGKRSEGRNEECRDVEREELRMEGLVLNTSVAAVSAVVLL